MRYLEEIDMRRLVLTSVVGTPSTFCIAGKDPVQTQRVTQLFAGSRAIPVTVELVADGVRVTRGAQGTTNSRRRWDLDGLARGARLTFTVAPAEHHKLRLAASQKGRVMGWTIRCRIQDDGTMLVYRTDAGAPQATGDSGTTGSIEA